MSSSPRLQSLAAHRRQAVEMLTSTPDGDSRFRALVDLSPDAILIHVGGRFTYANPAALKLLRASGPEQILGLSATEIVAPAFRERAMARMELLLRGESVPPIDHRWLRFDGTTVAVEVTASPYATGASLSVQVFAREITERKAAQAKIARLTSLYAALSRTSQAVARFTQRKELFDEVCRIAVEHGGLQTTWIGMVDPATRRVLPVASSGPGESYCRQIMASTDPAIPEGCGLIGTAVREGRQQISNNLSADPRAKPWRRMMAAYGLRSTAAFPIAQGGLAVGAIVHYAAEQDFFDPELTDLLARMAEEISFALERLMAEEQRIAAQAALQEQQRQLSTLIVNLPGMVYRCRYDPDWTMEFVSDGCLELTGYHPEELMFSRTVSYEAITHAHDRLRVREAIRRAMQAHTRFSVDYRIIQRSGRERWVQERGLGIYDERGELRFIEGFLTDISEVKSYREQLEHQATHDTLTGLANRNLLHDRMHQAIANAQRHRRLLATVFLDLDNFKFVNDTVGHTLGDELLKLAASRLRACVRDGDTVARLGGDEFVLLLLDEPNPESVSHAVQRILATMARPYRVGGKEFAVTGSMGVSLFPQDGADGETLLKNADAAMYRAKAQGRNSFHFYTAEINQALNERMALERDLRLALQREEFVVHYQPKVSLVSGQMVGAEALVRWLHPEQGMLSPARFIPVAEETGLIVQLGEWILRHACGQARRWREAGLDFKVLSVNLSMRQFRSPDLVRQVSQALSMTGLPPDALDLELTESLVMDDAEEFIAKLRALKSLGVQLSVDDFGTGYSSLSYLKQFPVDRLKLDKSFVRHVVTDKGDAAIAQAVVRLGQILGLAVTAEGVETEEQLAFLRRYGCDEAQGYLFSPPLPAEAFEALWRQGRLAPVAETAYRELPAVV